MSTGIVGEKRETKTKWAVLAGIVFIHVSAIAGFWTFTWEAFWVFVGLSFLTGLFGITLCFHRLLAHRSFHVPKWFEYVLTVCGSLAMQGGPIKWVATHRVHHAYSDRPSDPHSPLRGFWWGHMLWLFAYDELFDEKENVERFAHDLAKDPGHALIERTMPFQPIVLGILLFVLGGWPFLIWGLFVRAVAVYHITWLVNSAAHLWGYQTYDTNEGSRNNWWVGILSFGEGWHNNHHAYLHSAAHGLRWWEFDLTYLMIRIMAWTRLASRVRLPQGKPARLPDALQPIRKSEIQDYNLPTPASA